jgi:anaerobic magnesium-protoporphyrin IX monomethyl ester cyclase
MRICRSNERIVEELKLLIRLHAIKEVSFVDDVFTNRRGGPRQLCELMVQEGLNLTWYCNARANQISPKMALAMRRAGCHQVLLGFESGCDMHGTHTLIMVSTHMIRCIHQVFLGFESGCDEMLLRMNKGETVRELEAGAALLKSVGIRISIGFIVGYPGETQASVDRTIALCNRVRPDRAQFTRFTPIPGSEAARIHAQDANGPMGFHCRDGTDLIEGYIEQCYRECVYPASV